MLKSIEKARLVVAFCSFTGSVIAEVSGEPGTQCLDVQDRSLIRSPSGKAEIDRTEGIIFGGGADYESFCIETGSAGTLTSGEMGKSLFSQLVNFLVEKTKTNGPYSQMFKVQTNKGYYGKVCNNDTQKQYFKEHFITGNGAWHCNTSCSNEGNIISNYYNKYGIFSFSVWSNNSCSSNWTVCEYKTVSAVPSWPGTWKISYKIGSTSYTDTLRLNGSASNITGTDDSGKSLWGSLVGKQVCVVQKDGTYLSSIGYMAVMSWCFNLSTRNAHNIPIFVDSANQDVVSTTSTNGSATKTSSIVSKEMDQMESLGLGVSQEARLTEIYKSIIMQK